MGCNSSKLSSQVPVPLLLMTVVNTDNINNVCHQVIAPTTATTGDDNILID